MIRSIERQIVPRFRVDGTCVGVEPFGAGLINMTFVSSVRTGKGVVRYLHQQINENVFRKPEDVMENILRVTAHLHAKIVAAGGDPRRETLCVVPAVDGKPFYRDRENGGFWRTFLFIEDARTCESIENHRQARQAASAFGLFQAMLSDLDGGQLHETIPGFHDMPARFDFFLGILDRDPVKRSRLVKSEIVFLLNRRESAALPVDLLRNGHFPERIVHNDTKINNILFDKNKDRALCVVDLDTVMPGLAPHDFGDMVRIGANPVFEDERDLSKVCLDMDLFVAFTEGYLEQARRFLAPAEIAHLASSVKLMTYEQCLRFLTDYLQGDVYYKMRYPDHNLVRCRNQKKLVEEIERSMDRMEKAVETAAGRMS